ncbi:hypothetical protein RJT34_30268 [Clitoria ternatea]|uniref:NAD(P)H dehydrogenase (quinone) n=1 Tax=Clitoria ternatea TaxID=43366 RepID=A0AAN9ESF6_CLITE
MGQCTTLYPMSDNEGVVVRDNELTAVEPRADGNDDDNDVGASLLPQKWTRHLDLTFGATPVTYIALPDHFALQLIDKYMSLPRSIWNRYYSMNGHVESLAQEIKKGADSVEGVVAKLWQVPETLNNEELGKLKAKRKSDVPMITPEELLEGDGFVFGFPTRFGMMAAQFQAFLEGTGFTWPEQRLQGKPAGIFCSTGCQGGGQETTVLTAIPHLVSLGMLFVPIGYRLGAGMFEKVLKGGGPYGAGTYAGTDGLRMPNEIELRQAFHQGKCIANITKKLKQAS